MKKLILAVIVTFISTASFGQVKEKPAVDTAANENTPLLSLNDIKFIIGEMQTKCADPIRQTVEAIIAQRAAEYKAARKATTKSN